MCDRGDVWSRGRCTQRNLKLARSLASQTDRCILHLDDVCMQAAGLPAHNSLAPHVSALPPRDKRSRPESQFYSEVRISQRGSKRTSGREYSAVQDATVVSSALTYMRYVPYEWIRVQLFIRSCIRGYTLTQQLARLRIIRRRSTIIW